MGIRSDLMMVSVAVNNGYPISDEARQEWVDTASQVMRNGNNREKLAALRVLVLMDQLNKKEERERMGDTILGIAERLGLREEVIVASEGTTVGASCPALQSEKPNTIDASR